MDTVDVTDIREFSTEDYQKIDLFETERMFADVYSVGPGQEQTPHAHDDADKVYYVLEGTGTFVVGDEERRLDSGTAVIAPAGERHGIRNDSEEPLRALVFVARNYEPEESGLE